MPTGSLCAERNVIGTALSADITLRREDIKIVAVYSASMPAPAHTSTNAHSALQRSGSTSSVADRERERAASYSSVTGNCFSQHTSVTGKAKINQAAYKTVYFTYTILYARYSTGSPQRSNSISFAPASPVASAQHAHTHSAQQAHSGYNDDVLSTTTPVASHSTRHHSNGSEGEHAAMAISSQANTPIGEYEYTDTVFFQYAQQISVRVCVSAMQCYVRASMLSLLYRILTQHCVSP